MAEGVASILVVDDDPDVCWALKRVLCEEGLTVETVESGSEALTRLQDTRFQLILIDAKLSDIDG
ncbi:MAG: response regulator, partial [Nitrospirae bacterium]